MSLLSKLRGEEPEKEEKKSSLLEKLRTKKDIWTPSEEPIVEEPVKNDFVEIYIGDQKHKNKPFTPTFGEPTIEPEKKKGFQLPKLPSIEEIGGHVVKMATGNTFKQDDPWVGREKQEREAFASGALRSVPFVGDKLSSQENYERLNKDLPTKFTTPEIGIPFTDKTIPSIDVKAGELGNLAGTVALTAVQYGAIGKLLGKLGTTGKIGQVLGGSKAAKFGAKQATDLLADVIIQSPQEAFRSIQADGTLDTFQKEFLQNRMLDITFNLAIGGSMDAIGAINEAKKLKNVELEKYIQLKEEMLPPNIKQQLTEGVTIDPSKVAKSVGDGQDGILKNVESVDNGSLLDRLKNANKEIKSYTEQIDNVPNVKTQAETIQEPDFGTLELPVPKESPIAKGTPIDTSSRVLVDMPKRVKGKASDAVERLYQEMVSKNVPFERIGGKANIQASNTNRIQGTIEHMVIGKQVGMQGDEIGKSIKEIFADVPTNSKLDLYDAIFNKHNVSRWKEGKPVFGESIDDVMSAKKYNDFIKANPKLAGKQEEVTKYFKNLMDEWGVKSGLVSKKTSDYLAEMYPDYIPTYRAKDLPKSMLDSSSTVGQVIKKAKGGDEFILPLDQQMIAMTDRFVKNARRNELMNTVASEFLDGNKQASRYITSIKKTGEGAIEDILDVGRNFDEAPVIKGKEYVVNFYKDGEPMQMTVNKTLYKALEQSSSDEFINTVARTVKKYATQPFKNLVTGYNPTFAASNIMRDVPTALAYSANPVKMMGEVPSAVKEMMADGEAFRLFKAMGGLREGIIGAGKEFKVPTMGRVPMLPQIAKKANPIKWLGDVNNFTETLPRFTEFLAVYKATNDPALAIYKSAELTTDFARHGKFTKLLDNFVPYLNPAVQGMDKFGRSMLQNPLKTAAKASAVMTIPTLMLDQINKDNEYYNNLPARERNLYFNIPLPGTDGEKFFRIPKSRELGVLFSSTAEWAARASRGQKVTGKEIAEAIKENFSVTQAPIWSPAQKAWSQIKDPSAYETNYWGGLIIPESQRRYSPGQQYDDKSSGISKAIGQQFGVSPFVVDYILSSYGGIVGQVIKPIGANVKNKPLDILERKFITDSTYKTSSLNDFYEKMNEANKAAQDYNREHDVPSKTVTPLEKEANRMKKIYKKMKELKDRQNELKTKKGTEEERRRIQQEINRLAASGL